jgi:hypothetical protein
MKSLTKIFTRLLLLAGAALWSNAASATWLSLADGEYDLTLSTCSSGIISCPATPFTGSLTINGAGASFLSIAINGELFEGDPIDFIQTDAGDPTITYNRSSILHQTAIAFSFFSLVDPAFVFLPNMANLWIYCSDSSTPNGLACTPGTSGEWSATLRPNAVPLPGTTLLLGLGFIALGFARRRRAV